MDRWIGIPFLILIGILHRKRTLDRSKVSRIGLMKTVAIGDTLMIAGVLADIRKAYPMAKIIMITGKDNAMAGRLIGDADEQVVISPTNPLSSVRAVRRAKLDVIIDFGPWARFDAALAALSGAGFKVGFQTPGQWRHLVFDAAIAHRWDVHEIDNFRSLAAALGVQSTSEPRVQLPRTDLGEHRPKRPFVVFHAWSGGYRGDVKELPAGHWVELGKRATARGWAVVLTGSQADLEKTQALAASLSARGVPVEVRAGVLDLLQLGELFLSADVVVSVNTGVMHLAGEIGAPVVSLEGPTDPARWGPRGPRVRSVRTRFEGCGYLQLGWEYEGHRTDCMLGIDVDEVFEAMTALSQRG